MINDTTDSIPLNIFETIWDILQPMHQVNDRIYWRVLAKETPWGTPEVSEIRTFKIEQ